ncbi:MFS transporter [soil metagenome]
MPVDTQAQAAAPAAGPHARPDGAVASGAFPPGTSTDSQLRSANWALLYGNFVIGCALMVVAGTLPDIARALKVSVSLAGQLTTIAGVVVGLGAPLLASVVSGWDRRRLLSLCMLWIAVGQLLCALAPSYAVLWPLRALTMLAAAVFTPQAGVAIAYMAPPGQRGRSITFILVGWSFASVVGLPLSSWVGEELGWRFAFGAVGVLAVIGVVLVRMHLPRGILPQRLSAGAWGQIFSNPVLMGLVAVTALQCAGQFTVFSYITPYYFSHLGASAGQVSGLLVWFGIFGLIGNMLLSRYIDHLGASRASLICIALIAVGMALWPLGVGIFSTALVIVPWALGYFSVNSAQQARLSQIAPSLAPAMLALNTSGVYLGQAAGAAGGGWLIAHSGFDGLNWVGLSWLVVAAALSVWAARYGARHVGTLELRARG